jgi:hypothetical protein
MFKSTALRRNLNLVGGGTPCHEAIAFVAGKAEVEERSYKWNMGERMEGEEDTK